MRLKIHRGASEIGGSCVEMEYGGKRLLIDLGLPLDANAHGVPLPPVEGLQAPDPGLLGILLSHPHQDHWGLIPALRVAVPVYMGRAASNILKEAAFFGVGEFDATVAGYLEDWQGFDLGPFHITPFLNDHSAFDSYSILISAGGVKVFYTGDFRAHGRKKSLFERLVHHPPRDVDVMLTEGTHVPVQGAVPGPGMTEEDVRATLAEEFKKAHGCVLIAMSAQNIDRLVSVYKACRNSGRTLVVDLYSASIAMATGRDTIPRPGYSDYLVWVPYSQRVRVKRAKAFQRVNEVKNTRIYPEKIAEIAPKAVFLFRPGMARELEQANCMDNADLVWSMWKGYLKPPHNKVIQRVIDRYGLVPKVIHSSGHADIEDIRRLIGAIQPKSVVPMHTFGAQRFRELFSDLARVDVHADGQWWEVS